MSLGREPRASSRREGRASVYALTLVLSAFRRNFSTTSFAGIARAPGGDRIQEPQPLGRDVRLRPRILAAALENRACVALQPPRLRRTDW